MKERKTKTIEFILRGKKVTCEGTYIPKNKILTFIFKHAHRPIKEVSLPTSAKKIAEKMLIDLDVYLAKEIFKIDIIC